MWWGTLIGNIFGTSTSLLSSVIPWEDRRCRHISKVVSYWLPQYRYDLRVDVMAKDSVPVNHSENEDSYYATAVMRLQDAVCFASERSVSYSRHVARCSVVLLRLAVQF
jgi:hypothetical protein